MVIFGAMSKYIPSFQYARETDQFCAPFLRKFLLFLCGDPLQTPRRTPAPEYCVSSRKRRSFEVPERGGIEEGRGRWGGEKRRKKGRAKSAQERSCNETTVTSQDHLAISEERSLTHLWPVLLRAIWVLLLSHQLDSNLWHDLWKGLQEDPIPSPSDGMLCPPNLVQESVGDICPGPEKGVITKGVFSLEESLESLLSLESLKHGRIRLCFPQHGDSLESLNSLESLELCTPMHSHTEGRVLRDLEGGVFRGGKGDGEL